MNIKQYTKLAQKGIDKQKKEAKKYMKQLEKQNRSINQKRRMIASLTPEQKKGLEYILKRKIQRKKQINNKIKSITKDIKSKTKSYISRTNKALTSDKAKRIKKKAKKGLIGLLKGIKKLHEYNKKRK
jgi:CHASE3 domain sensor protein